MTTFGMLMTLLGAATVAVNIVRLFDALDNPRPRRRTA